MDDELTADMPEEVRDLAEFIGFIAKVMFYLEQRLYHSLTVCVPL